MIVGIPIKPFGVAKARLSPALDGAERSLLGKAVAGHTARQVAATGAVPVIITSDRSVEQWAIRSGIAVVAEPSPGGLDHAATAFVTWAGDRTWAVVHADLPLLTTAELAAVWRELDEGPVICPSHDGGTSVVAGRGRFRFSYGPGSFHRHLRTHPHSSVVVRRGLALDLDTIEDFAIARRLPAGRWLDEVLTSRRVRT